LSLSGLAERTEVLYGTDKVISEELQFFFKTTRQIDTCMDHTRPPLAIGIESIKRSFVDAKNRGVKLRYLTEITDANISYCKELMSIVDETCACLSSGGMQYSYHFFEIRKNLLEKQKKGEHKGVRYISNITQDNEKFVKAFLDAGIMIRHVKNLQPMSFGVSDKEIVATIEKMEGGKMVQSLLLSNEPAYIDHFCSIFEDLWAKGIDAKDRIKEIHEGTDLTDIELIQNPRRAMTYNSVSQFNQRTVLIR
jgi:two-component system, OmpR family, sensor histidine kinase VicK